MTGFDFEKIRAIFLDASALAEPERSAFLDRACAGDARLRAEVESLLASESEANTGFLEAPALGDAFRMDDAVREPVTPGPAEFEGPKTVGPYKLLQVIGEGGFGVVYMAEQEKPVRRRVALKLIRLGMDTKHVLARFEAERQALAMMDHPNIARVLDAGATDAGRPYFVMELVRGVPITEYCDHEKLGTQARLDLFIAVCRAVQHAHQKGIIHRDIKPSNILVTLHDGVPVPKVIDFGIAKATSARLTERTLFTDFRQFIGTPEYMSPEQAEMSGLDVDTRSDIYSLGVLLYELLSGETPLSGKTLRSAGYADMQKMIREFEPVRPSVRLSSQHDTVFKTARNRGVGVAELKRSLAGDLDWIALKALEKDRSRRYDTAAAFAAVIERFLRNEPIEARPPSVTYRARKFIRRNSAAVSIASIVLVGLVFASVALGFLYTRAHDASVRASAAEARERALREQAQANLDRALKSDEQARVSLERSDRVKELLKSALGAGSANDVGWSRDTPASEVLRQFESALAGHEDQDPEVMAELLGVLGDSYVQLGMSEAALSARRRGDALARAVWAPDDPRTITAETDLAWIEREAGSTEESRSAIERIRSLPTWKSVDPDLRARALYVLANTYADANSASAAIELYQEALDAYPNTGDPAAGRGRGITDGLANALFQASRFEEALAMSEQLARDDPLTPSPSFNLLRRWHRHANRLLNLGRTDDAIFAMRRVAEISDQTLGPQHTDTTSRWHALAEWLVFAGRGKEADPILDRFISVTGADHRPAEQVKMLKVSAWSALAQDDPTRAEARLRDALSIATENELTNLDAPGNIWRDAQVWRLTAQHSVWADDALRRAVSFVVDDRFRTIEPGPETASHWVDWSALQWDLVRHGDKGPARSGDLAALRAIHDLPAGLYALRIRAPRESEDPVDIFGWFLLADWTVREFTLDGYAAEHPERFSAGEANPGVTRAERLLEYTWQPGRFGGTQNRQVGFGVVADAPVALPVGVYLIRVTSDDGQRLTINNSTVSEAWLGRSETTDETEINVAETTAVPWRLDYFQGADAFFLRLTVEPIAEFARPTLARLGITQAGASVGSP